MSTCDHLAARTASTSRSTCSQANAGRAAKVAYVDDAAA